MLRTKMMRTPRHSSGVFCQIVPYLAGKEETFKACRPALDLRLFFLCAVQKVPRSASQAA